RRDHLLDLLRVKLDPAIVAEFIEAVRRARALLRRNGRRRLGVLGVVLRQFAVGRLVLLLGRVGLAVGCLVVSLVIWLGIPFGAGVLLLAFLLGSLVAFVRLVGLLRLAHRDAVVETEHHYDDVGLLGGEDALGGGGPIGRLALRLILDEARGV